MQNVRTAWQRLFGPSPAHSDVVDAQVEGAPDGVTQPKVVHLTCGQVDTQRRWLESKVAELTADNAGLTAELDGAYSELAEQTARANNLDRVLGFTIPAMLEVGPELARILRVNDFTVAVTPGRDGAQVTLGSVTIQVFPRLEKMRATGESLPTAITVDTPALSMTELFQFAIKGLAEEAAAASAGTATTVNGTLTIGLADNGVLPVESRVTTAA